MSKQLSTKGLPQVDVGDLVEVTTAAVARAIEARGHRRIRFPIVAGFIFGDRFPDGNPFPDEDPFDPFGGDPVRMRGLAQRLGQLHGEYMLEAKELKDLTPEQRTLRRLEQLKSRGLVTSDDHATLAKMLGALRSDQKTTAIAKLVKELNDQLVKDDKTSPVALVIASITLDSVTRGARDVAEGNQTESIAKGIFSSDADGAVEGAGFGGLIGAEAGAPAGGVGAVPGAVTGAVIGGAVGGGIASLGALLDSLFG